MKILNAKETKKADAFTIKNKPIASIDLMEYASRQCSKWILTHFFDNNQSSFIVLVGPGNNGGDGLAIARHLSACHLKITVVLLSTNLSPDAQTNYQRIENNESINIIHLQRFDDFPVYDSEVIIDALFGSGLSRPIEGLAAQIIQHVNGLKATTIAIDIPSGLFDEDNSQNNTASTKESAIIKATHTLTFETPFLSFFFADNEVFLGQWHVLPIGLDQKFIASTESKHYMLTKDTVKQLLKKRNKFSHKGTFGHSLLISGSMGKVGAAVLAAKACMRSGGGLLTIHAPQCGYQILQTAVPEAMVLVDNNYNYISGCAYNLDYTAIGIGPGIGQNQETENVLSTIIRNSKQPLVIDADAINIIAKRNDLLKVLPEKSIITPHPKEFERLVGKCNNNFEALQKQKEFAQKYQLIVVLKGAHTSIACPDGNIYFNTTGNPGMATAGSGDALTGMVLSLLAQNYNPVEAALIAVYIHGMAGDIAVKTKGETAMISSDLIDSIGEAFVNINLLP